MKRLIFWVNIDTRQRLSGWGQRESEREFREREEEWEWILGKRRFLMEYSEEVKMISERRWVSWNWLAGGYEKFLGKWDWEELMRKWVWEDILKEGDSEGIWEKEWESEGILRERKVWGNSERKENLRELWVRVVWGNSETRKVTEISERTWVRGILSDEDMRKFWENEIEREFFEKGGEWEEILKERRRVNSETQESDKPCWEKKGRLKEFWENEVLRKNRKRRKL